MSTFNPQNYILNHASHSPKKSFGSLCCFGSVSGQLAHVRQDALLIESSEPLLVYPVKLEMSRALITSNLYQQRPLIVSRVAEALAQSLTKSGRRASPLLEGLSAAKTTPRTVRELASVLQDLGYDGLAYRNPVAGFNVLNLAEDQVRVLGKPLTISSNSLKESVEELREQTARPAELGDAYFWIDGSLVDIYPERNHRDWLLLKQQELDLPEYIQQKPVRALWEAYKKGIIRIVWDAGSKWKTGAGHGQGNVLYLNGFERDVWSNMRQILNSEPWVGHINAVVIEYVRDVNGKPNWYHTDIFKGGAVESLYRGRRPRRERLPPDAVYGGDPGIDMVREVNHMMNTVNDTAPTKVLEMFNSHFMSTGFFDKFKHVPHNGYMTHPGHNYNVYLGLT